MTSSVPAHRPLEILDAALVARALTRAPAGRRVLVVDDDEALAELLVRALAHHGFDVTRTPHPAYAIDRALDARLDVVIVDVGLDPFDGRRLCRALSTIAPDTTILAVTGHADDDTARACLAAGARAVLVKPVGARALADAVVAHLPPPRSRPEDAGPDVAVDEDARALARSFVARARVDIGALRAATSTSTDAMARLAHRLAGTAATFGLGALAARARAVERAARGPSVDLEPAMGGLVALLEVLDDACAPRAG